MLATCPAERERIQSGRSFVACVALLWVNGSWARSGITGGGRICPRKDGDGELGSDMYRRAYCFSTPGTSDAELTVRGV